MIAWLKKLWGGITRSKLGIAVAFVVGGLVAAVASLVRSLRHEKDRADAAENRLKRELDLQSATEKARKEATAAHEEVSKRRRDLDTKRVEIAKARAELEDARAKDLSEVVDATNAGTSIGVVEKWLKEHRKP